MNHGYALGLSWVTEHPADFAALAWARLGRLWSGATLGFGGWGLPFGLEGPRHAVDLVVPEGGALLTLWRLLLLAVLVTGLWMGRRRLLALWPWLALLLTKLVATLAFFGYARQGATLVPVLTLALALLVEPYLERLPTGRLLQVALACGLLLVVLEGVRFLSPPEVRIDDRPAVEGAVERAGADDVVDRLAYGLDTQLGPTWDEGVEVSYGQWQKLALARGFMRADPLVLVLDEPTSALDAETEHALFEHYASNARGDRSLTDGRITILVSHRFSTVRMADTIVVLDGSHVVEVGSHEDLMAAGGQYSELYTIQATSYR